MADGGTGNTSVDQLRQRLQQQQLRRLDRETMSELMSSLTLVTAERTCFHGAGHALVPLPPRVDDFIGEFEQKMLQVEKKLSQRFDPFAAWLEIMDAVPISLHPNFEDRDACDKVIACLICLGTNYLIDAEVIHFNIAGWIAQTVLYVETMSRGAKHRSVCTSKMRDLSGDGEVAETVLFSKTMSGDDPGVLNRLDCQSKMRDLWGDCEREVVKFFHKRNVCTCLKGQYERWRNQTKMGMCTHCHEITERKKLMLCAQCKVAQYCSAECQREDWHSRNHRDWCNRHRADHVLLSV